ncbi:zinc-binding dehydrogenase [Sphingomonas sp.]|uniref:zinc-binding dehydrogenase n=1 Tax=Sphingomonas sp. TaxID=28214 RepID=UPI0025DA75FD|nr:zinc-binding dehydrogenase [Sphingomonas sp.]
MKAMILSAFGGAPDSFEAAELANPAPGPGEVLVRVVAASINPADTKIRQHGGLAAPALPAVLGCDMAGVVVAVGEGVTGFAVGDRVYGCVGGVRGSAGTYAELVVADARLLAHAPETLSLHDAAALPLVAITAWEALDRLGVGEGTHLLVHGGAGGVGHVAIQLAKARGARVATTISSPDKAEIVRGFGADEIINYREESVADYVERLTGGQGFDAVFDSTGGSDLATSFVAARVNGQVAVIVASYSADLTPMHAKALSFHAIMMLVPLLYGTGREAHGRILADVARLADQGRLKPLIDAERFTLAEVGKAHARLESGQALGKLVIDVTPE